MNSNSDKAIELIRPYIGQYNPPEPNWNAEDMWFRMVGQICAIGGTRGWDAVSTQILHPNTITAAEDPYKYVWTILRGSRVRYISDYDLEKEPPAKVKAIVRNASKSWALQLPEFIRRVSGSSKDWKGMFGLWHSKIIRRALISTVGMFGPKSSSNFLMGMGLTQNMMAFDVRVMNLLIGWKIFEPTDRSRLSHAGKYALMEEQLQQQLCDPLRITLAELDWILFNHYDDLKKR